MAELAVIRSAEAMATNMVALAAKRLRRDWNTALKLEALAHA